MTNYEDKLLCRYLDGMLAEEEKELFQDLLRNSSEARKKLRMLATVTEGISGRKIAPKLIRAPLKFTSLPWIIAAAATIMAVMGWMDGILPESDTSDGSDAFIALLVDEAGAEFASGYGPDDIRFQPGKHELERGTIHLRFANGADVVMKAPASFEIKDGFHMRLHHGDIWAMAPPSAQGFTVETPGVDYEDLGTEFAISVNRDTGENQLHVIDGQVDARNPDSKKLISSVTEGQSQKFADGRSTQVDAPDSGSYIRPESIGFLRWEQQRANFGKDDPDLIGYYPFTKSESLQNEAHNPVTGDGEIKGARWVTGRWPGKAALLFDRDTDFVELDIPGDYEELSFSAWLKLDRLDYSHNAIFNSSGWDMGDVHWTICRYGTMGIDFKGAKTTEMASLEAVPIDQWVHVAATISGKSKRSYVYLNGKLAGTRRIDPKTNLMRPGVGRIGNWFMGDREDLAPTRALRGKVDGFAIWKRALTEKEIKTLVENGKPSALWSLASR